MTTPNDTIETLRRERNDFKADYEAAKIRSNEWQAKHKELQREMDEARAEISALLKENATLLESMRKLHAAWEQSQEMVRALREAAEQACFLANYFHNVTNAWNGNTDEKARMVAVQIQSLLRASLSDAPPPDKPSC